jgi:aconitate hydratase
MSIKKNLTFKILEAHLTEGELSPGKDIAIRIDHTLLQDATGTLAMLEFEALGIDQVKVELAAQYVDHNLLQTDNKNADDHKFLQTASARYGVYFSKPGNGVSHQVHMERFGIPGKTLLGADSHTPGAAGISMLGIGAGGLDVALAMAGYPYHLICPKVLGVKLTGELPEWVSAKDVILEMLRRYDVKGCVGKVIEYCGPGVKTLSATDRETIGNMGTESGATTSIFPSDERTKEYLIAQGRGDAWVPLSADEGAAYDEYAEIDLSKLEPLIAKPSSPGNVVPVREIAGLKVGQAIVGSSVNSSFRDLMVAAKMLAGRRVHPDTSFHVNPGSRQVLENVYQAGGLLAFLTSGTRVHEPGCQGCIGMGQAPATGEVSLRTFPRNFPGRSGTKDDKVYLCSPETATAAALTGVITDPRDLAREMKYPHIDDPEQYLIDEKSIISPSEDLRKTGIIRGPNIKSLPELKPLPDKLEAEVVLKVGNNISTDTIMPAGNRVLPFRSNIAAISEFVYSQIDPDFAKECKARGTVIVIGGENYGQGSSREHAALAPRYLGVRAKIVKSYARIHKSNLCNFGIIPLTFKDPKDYDRVNKGTKMVFSDIRRRIERGDREIPAEVDGQTVITILDVTERQRKHLLAGGALNFVKNDLLVGVVHNL